MKNLSMRQEKNSLPVSIVSNIFKPVGPSAPGGLEVFNYYLTQELAKKDVDIELFASGDSDSPYLKPLVEKSLEYSKPPQELAIPWNYRRMTVAEFIAYTDFVQKQQGDRLIHFSLVNFLPVYLAVKKGLKILLTLHMSVKNLHYQALTQLLSQDELQRVHFIGISQHQVKDFPYTYKIIPNGVDTNAFGFQPDYQDKFIWIGRLVKEKGTEDAIKAAQQADFSLEIGGSNKTPDEQKYFKESIEPNLNQKIRYKGFINANQRNDFYAAKATLFVSKLIEPAPLILIESLACGTPVIAYNNGLASEIIQEGRTGFLVQPNDINGLVKAMQTLNSMPKDEYEEMRSDCRRYAEENLSLSKMTNRYIETYQEIWQNE